METPPFDGEGASQGADLGPAPWVQGQPAEPPPPQRRRRRAPRRGSGDGGPPPDGPTRRPRRRPTRETMARVGVAIPWIVFAVAIVVLGGIPFALAMIGLAMIGMAELFRMTRRFHPLPPVALAAAVALVIAAYYGGQFQMVVVLAATFPVLFIFAAARGPRDGGATTAVAITLLAIMWIAVPFAHAMLLRKLPLHGGALVIDVLVATF